jgi:hypothetical protein
MLARFTRNSAPFLKTSSAPECRWRKICKIEADRSFVSWILESAERCLVEQRRGASTLHYVRLRVALLIGFRGRHAGAWLLYPARSGTGRERAPSCG